MIQLSNAEYAELITQRDRLLASVHVNQFVLDHLFHSKVLEDGTIAYWRECKEDGEGYIVLYADGQRLHTYHNPENFL